MEYVKKELVKPHRQEFYEIIEKVRTKVKDQSITFSYVLIGSAKRNLVVKHHNKGFDCDFQITISKDGSLDARSLKMAFINAFDDIVTNYGYSFCEDSTQSITIKKKDIPSSSVEKGYDVIIVKVYDDGVHILRNDKVNFDKSDYHFVPMKDTKNYHDNFAKIKGSSMWNDVRDLYLEKREIEELKTENRKKAFQVLNDTVLSILDKNNNN